MHTRVLSPEHPDYPALAFQRGERRTLHVRGTLPPAGPAVAIVGTRRSTRPADELAWAVAFELAARGVVVWSGGAVGIDARAHTGALDAGAATVVVLAGGLDRPYPRCHRALFERVLASRGALLALHPDGTAPLPPYFLQRNALLSAATHLTVVVQAGTKSGALSTAAGARRVGAGLAVVPHAPWDRAGRGCAELLADGAAAITCASEAWVQLAACCTLPPFGRSRLPSTPSASAPRATTAAEATVLRLLRGGPCHPDTLCERSGLTPAEVMSTLALLSLRGAVVEVAGGWYRGPGS